MSTIERMMQRMARKPRNPRKVDNNKRMPDVIIDPRQQQLPPPGAMDRMREATQERAGLGRPQQQLPPPGAIDRMRDALGQRIQPTPAPRPQLSEVADAARANMQRAPAPAGTDPNAVAARPMAFQRHLQQARSQRPGAASMPGTPAAAPQAPTNVRPAVMPRSGGAPLTGGANAILRARGRRGLTPPKP